MQNRYTGDIGDFGKLGLLRQISEAEFSIGVNWYLTPDESHNGEAKFYPEILDFSDTEKAERQICRWEWHSRAKQLLQGCDIVFADRG